MSEEDVKPEELDSASTEENQNVDETGDGQEHEQEESHADDNAAQRNKVPAGKRIRQLTRKYREEERRRIELEGRLKALEERIGPAPEPKRPSLDDFDSQEEYEDALLEWHDARRNHAEPAKEVSDFDSETEKSPVLKAFEAELEKAIGDEAVMAVIDEEWPCNTYVTDYVMASEHRAHLAYYLATHHDIADQIANMSPILAARELTKVEAEVASNLNTGAASDKTPPPPLDTNKPSAVATTDLDKMSADQYLAYRRKQMAEGH